jgi:hypothetical protein
MTRSLCGTLCSAALLALAGCSDDGLTAEEAALFDQLDQNTDFRLDGTSIDVNSYEVASLEMMDDIMTVAARSVVFTCIEGDPGRFQPETAFRADIHIGSLAALSLGTPVSVGDPSAPIQAELSIIDFNTNCLFWKGAAQGTVMITSVELRGSPSQNVVRGSFDLRAEDAQPTCSTGTTRLIEMRWDNFEPMNKRDCREE